MKALTGKVKVCKQLQRFDIAIAHSYIMCFFQSVVTLCNIAMYTKMHAQPNIHEYLNLVCYT